MKKIVSLILSLALILSFTACGTKAEAGWKEQYDLGVKYVNEAKYEEAILAFTKALEIDPKQTPVYIALAQVYVRQENYTAAAETLDKAISETKPDKADVYIDLIEIYIQQGDLDAAQDVLDKAIEELGETEELLAEKEKLEDMQSGQENNQEDTPTQDNTSESEEVLPQNGPAPSADRVRGVVRTLREDYDDGTYTIYGYNADSYVECSYNYTANGTLNSFRINTYDDEWNHIRQDAYNSDGELEGYWIHSYDDRRNRVRDDWYNADGSLEGYWINSYDDDGNFLDVKRYSPDGSEI